MTTTPTTTSVDPVGSGTDRPPVGPGRRPSRAVGALLVAGPLLVGASELVEPRFPDGVGATAEAAFLHEHAGRFTLGSLVGILAGAVLVVGFTLVAARLAGEGRGSRLLRAGGVLGAVGGVGVSMHHTLTLAIVEVLGAGVPAATVSSVGEGPSAAVSILALLVGMTLGLLLVAGGAVRSGRGGWWILALAVVAVVADFSPSSWNTVGWAALALPVVAVLALRAPAAGTA